MELFQARASALIELLHLRLGVGYFLPKAREGIQSRCIGIGDGKIRRGPAVALGR